jgi:hypothetical protein
MFERFRYRKYSFPVWDVVDCKSTETFPQLAASIQVLKFFIYDKKLKQKKEVTENDYNTIYKNCEEISF